MSEKQRDEALGTIKVLNDTVEKMKISSFKPDELRGMPIQKLKTLQVRRSTFTFFRKYFLTQFVFSQSFVANWKRSTRFCIR